jgi:hypothetical protein
MDALRGAPFADAEVGVGWALLPPVGVRFADMDGDMDGDERDDAAAPLVWMPGGGGRLILLAVLRVWLGTGIGVLVATGAMMAT